jgi:hypothetical protein
MWSLWSLNKWEIGWLLPLLVSLACGEEKSFQSERGFSIYLAGVLVLSLTCFFQWHYGGKAMVCFLYAGAEIWKGWDMGRLCRFV